MRLLHLQLFDYHNFHRLDLSLPAGPSVLIGANAQGKTNLLEALQLLATMRALRAETDVQLIRRESLDGPLPAARLVASAETIAGPLKLELAVVARPGPQGPIAGKTVRVNGVPRRLSDAVGRFLAVLFTAEDIELVSGPPASRRQFLDITLSQVEPGYAAARHRFERVLLQRNHLLKGMREGGTRADELAFWDDQLCKDGGLLFHSRAQALRELDLLARGAHASLAPGEELQLAYRPRIEAAECDPACAGPESAVDAYARALRRGLQRDVAAGMTLQGPHRDDLLFSLNGLPASGFASRAQQRTIALALRLAEARFLLARRGDPPVLLLDDVLSEMDAARRQSVLATAADYQQVLLTSSDLDRFPPDFLSGAALFSVEAGALHPLIEEAASLRTGET